MPKDTIICVDDEYIILEGLKEQLLRITSRGCRVEMASSGEEALEIADELASSNVQVPIVISDHIMPGMNGDEFLIRFHERFPKTLKILLTGRADAQAVGNIINEAKLYRYIGKPWEETDLSLTVTEGLKLFHQERELGLLYEKARQEIEVRRKTEEQLKKAFAQIELLKEKLQSENKYLREELRESLNFKEIVGESKTLKEVLHKVTQVAPSDTTVLVTGETGTGKELVARAIHNESSRQGQPIIKVNCAALPSDLLESELFGHEKGAFTGAIARKIGRFELADGGTLFLDEIGELPLNLQAKILHAIEYGEFERVGNPNVIKVDARIVAATNRSLEDEVKEGTFRKDLYYRLNVYPINLPPLRSRKTDIPLLVRHYIDLFNKKLQKDIQVIPESTMQSLVQYPWPGNIRELRNLMERAVILSSGDILSVEIPQGGKITVEEFKTLEDYERDYIVRVLAHTNGKVAGPGGASGILGMNQSTLRARIQKLGIKSKNKF